MPPILGADEQNIILTQVTRTAYIDSVIIVVVMTMITTIEHTVDRLTDIIAA